MTIASELRIHVSDIINRYGKQVKFTYFDEQFDASDYDDSVDLLYSGTTWASGLVFPIKANRGSVEATLLEQGKILNNDTKLYITGDINTSGTFRIGLGSPTVSEYSLIPDTVQAQEIGGVKVYKLLYLRRLPIGSLIGE
jgi:hypothetical protein